MVGKLRVGKAGLPPLLVSDRTIHFLLRPRISVSQPLAALFAQQIPIERHLVDAFIHPRRQLAAINIATHRNAIILLRGEYEALRRSYEFIESSGLFFVGRATHHRDAVRNYRRAAGWKHVADWNPFLLLVNPYIRKIPQTNEPLATHKLLH